MAPAFTIGFVRPSEPCSTAASELNGRPVALAPIFRRISSGPSDWQTSANTNGFATLMIANSASASPAAHSSPLVATTQMPKSSRGTRASAGYTLEISPRSSDL